MRTYEKIQLRAFDVRIRDERTGEECDDVIILSKQQAPGGADLRPEQQGADLPGLQPGGLHRPGHRRGPQGDGHP